MSKRALRKYLDQLAENALRDQILDLYNRFPEVKTYYDFVFNPKEDKLVEEARAKIREEYFPVRRKKAKARRSVAKKYIRHFGTLGVEPTLMADLMGFNLEIALDFSRKRPCYEAFFKSMYVSFKEWVGFTVHNGLYGEYQDRIQRFAEGVSTAQWPNQDDFDALLEQLQPYP
jgi:hypothetical protein